MPDPESPLETLPQRRYDATASAAEPVALRRAYRAAWHWFRELEAHIPRGDEVAPRDALLAAVEARVRRDLEKA